MTRAAFYAPMKSPEHPVPSGDRAMARALMTALRSAGLEIDLASELASRDSKGDRAVQEEKLAQARMEIDRLVPLGRKADWRVWLTYHNYYKAPDLIGPAVAKTLDIPYLLVEATRARKRLTGPWAGFARAAEEATDAANAVFYLTDRDAEALRAYRRGTQRLVHLPPFLPSQTLPPATSGNGRILSVGMMRKGDKLGSYRLIAESLELLRNPDWQLLVAGDGPARADVHALLARFGDRVVFPGALAPDDLNALYCQSSILFWPGVNEAFGMVYLEAQAAGLTVVAQDRPGVRDVLCPGAAYPDPATGAAGLAQRLDLLLSTPKLRHNLGREARDHVSRHHLLDTARDRLKSVLDEVLS
jgi:glycosyltransferase involved in cell wall biosynthesis